EAGIRDFHVTGVQTCALPIYPALLGGRRVMTDAAAGDQHVLADREPPAAAEPRVEHVLEAMAHDILFDRDAGALRRHDLRIDLEIGRASCRERMQGVTFISPV